MRLASSLLLCVLTASTGLALANCSSSDADGPNDEAFSDDEINGANNRMGLRLIYDEPSSTVRATVRTRLRTGEQLKLRVRRGRLSSAAQMTLDCNQLPEAPRVPPSEEPNRVVYQGPSVDATLLASVYNDAWIQGNITAAMLDDLARDGADSIVEACIVKGDNVRARLQTSVAYAWDLSDPNLAETNRDLARASLDEGMMHFNAGDAGSSTSSSAARIREGRPIQSMEKYAELCVAELGDIPFFKKIAAGKYETFDCRDFVGGQNGSAIEGVEGALIPQSQHDAAGADTTPRECDDRSSGRYNCWKTCDKPEWLFQSCEPGPTVTTAKNDKGTHWTLLCRSTGKRGAEDTPAKLLKTKVFNDIAMIGHNPKTGKTCFFQNKIFEGTDGAKVTHPGDTEKSRDIWDQPKGYCMRCHSAEAFIHSPWIDGAKRRDGTPIVPMMGKNADFEISWNASPFSVVNRKAQADARVGGGSWELPKHLVSEGGEACTTCHRIGGGDGMKRFPMWAVGEEGLDEFTQGTSGPIKQRWSGQANTFEASHWMPLRLDGLTAENWSQSKYAKAVKHIKSCAANNSAAGCEWADVPDR